MSINSSSSCRFPPMSQPHHNGIPIQLQQDINVENIFQRIFICPTKSLNSLRHENVYGSGWDILVSTIYPNLWIFSSKWNFMWSCVHFNSGASNTTSSSSWSSRLCPHDYVLYYNTCMGTNLQRSACFYLGTKYWLY